MERERERESERESERERESSFTSGIYLLVPAEVLMYLPLCGKGKISTGPNWARSDSTSDTR